MSSTFSRVLAGTLLVGFGFSTGWWLRGLNEPRPPVAPPPAAPAAVQPHVQAPAAVAARPAPAAPPVEPPALATAEPAPEAPPAQPEETITERFRSLLNTRAFEAAMNLYVEVQHRDTAKAAELKSLVMSYLQRYLKETNGVALTGLVDAFLSRYYDDLDVLLLLARHQLQSDYLAEAAHTFQLAFTYAYNGAEQQQVQRAFQSFVQQVDQLLGGQGRWRDLISFYETLELLDLIQPEFQLRLAELYLARGEPEYGRNLLRRLTTNPAVATRAEAMLAGVRPQARPQPTTAQDTVALGLIGSHYHLPLRLNNAADVELIIDTGATTTTLSRRAFESLVSTSGFVKLGPQVFNTANGVAKGTMYRVDRVQLGNQTLSDVHIAVLDFNTPAGIDGLLGMNILRNFRFQVDQDEQRLYLRPRRKSQ